MYATFIEDGAKRFAVCALAPEKSLITAVESLCYASKLDLGSAREPTSCGGDAGNRNPRKTSLCIPIGFK